jgi:hypothetical protein
MADDSIEAKALALVNEVGSDWGSVDIPESINRAHDARCEALCRAIEQHEAYKQEVSNAVKDACKFAKDNPDRWAEYLAIRFSFIITPKPKPDPLVAALEGVKFDHYPPNDAKAIRTALDAFGLEIREKGQ